MLRHGNKTNSTLRICHQRKIGGAALAKPVHFYAACGLVFGRGVAAGVGEFFEVKEFTGMQEPEGR
jgi:hypothetical protein